MKDHINAHTVIIHLFKVMPIKSISSASIQTDQGLKQMSLLAVNARTKLLNPIHI